MKVNRLSKKKFLKRNYNDEPLECNSKKNCLSNIDHSLPNTAFTQQKNTKFLSIKPKSFFRASRQPRNFQGMFDFIL